MTRAALLDKNLEQKFWPYAMKHAVRLRNDLPHKGLDNRTPKQVWFDNKDSPTLPPTFGCLAFVFNEAKRKKNKFATTATPAIYLGFSTDSSFDTCINYDPKTRAVSFPHLTDVQLEESSSYSKFKTCYPDLNNTAFDSEYISSDETDIIELEKLENIDIPAQLAAPASSTNSKLFSGPVSKKRRTVPINRLSFVTVKTQEPAEHSKKQRTFRETQKLREKVLKARLTGEPITFSDVNSDWEDFQEYRKAVDKELNTLETRGVLLPVRKDIVDKNAEVGETILLVSIKRSGAYKARLVYNGRQQRMKILPFAASPTLDPTTVSLALHVAASKNYLAWSFDVVSA